MKTSSSLKVSEFFFMCKKPILKQWNATVIIKSCIWHIYASINSSKLDGKNRHPSVKDGNEV